MLAYQSAISAIACLSLVTLSILVFENGRFDNKQKIYFYQTYFIIIAATLFELFGVLLNGAYEWTVPLHAFIKFMDYVITPTTGYFFVRQVSDISRKNRLLVLVLSCNFVFQSFSVFTGWTFYIDSYNVYHHGPLYWIYAAIYALVIAVVVWEFTLYARRFNKRNRGSLIAVAIIVVLCVLLQELVGGDRMRLTSLGLAIGSILLFIHFNEFGQQVTDAAFTEQKGLIELDPLTGLLNRYAYNKALLDYPDPESIDKRLVVFCFDVNDLKRANDTISHLAGDELIQGAANTIKKVMGTHGDCFRVGGDEFVSIVHIDKGLIDPIRKMLKKEAELWRGEKIGFLSISVGVAAAADNEGMDIEKLIAKADKDMYRDKDLFYRGQAIDRRS